MFVQPQYVPTNYDQVRDPGYVYPILITGMVFFMASNAMPNLLPEAQRIMNVAPWLIQWGFILLLFAIMTQWMHFLPGVTSMQVTWVNMTIAFLFFFLIWNQRVAEMPSPPRAESGSSRSASSSSSRPRESERREEKKEARPPEPSPWEEMRAHPSAFLTSRLNRLLPWPYPMGKAAAVGNELWWESGTPAHVGHFNRPAGEQPPSEAEKKRGQEAEAKAKERARQKEKERLRAEEKAKDAKEAAEKIKRQEEEMRRRTEAERARLAAIEARKRQAIETRRKQKLWRTKYLAMIVGISFLSRTFGFMLLLFFSLQLLGQELNAKPEPDEPVVRASSSSTSSSSSRGLVGSSSSSSSSSTRAAEEAQQKAREQALREREREKAKAAAAAAAGRPSSSLSSARPSSSSHRESSSKTAVTGEAIKAASGSKTVTGGDSADEDVQPPIGFGMHYIHAVKLDGGLDSSGSRIPSEGMSHPLMTSLNSHLAN